MKAIATFLPASPLGGRIHPVVWQPASSFLAVVFLLGLWQGASMISASTLIPPPVRVLQQIHDSWEHDAMIKTASGQDSGLAFNSWQTAKRFTRFMICGLVLAAGILFLTFLSPSLKFVMREVTWLANPIPPLLVLPILHACGCKTTILEWVAGAFYPALAAITLGVAPLSPEYRDLTALAQRAGAGKIWIATHIYWRALEETLLPALKSHGAYVIGITVVIEWMVAPDGLGTVMKYALSFSSGALLLAAVGLVGVLTICYEILIHALIKIRLQWKIVKGAV